MQTQCSLEPDPSVGGGGGRVWCNDRVVLVLQHGYPAAQSNCRNSLSHDMPRFHVIFALHHDLKMAAIQVAFTFFPKSVSILRWFFARINFSPQPTQVSSKTDSLTVHSSSVSISIAMQRVLLHPQSDERYRLPMHPVKSRHLLHDFHV